MHVIRSARVRYNVFTGLAAVGRLPPAAADRLRPRRLWSQVKEKENSLQGSIRQKISSVFRPSAEKRKAREWSSAGLYRALSECLQAAPEGELLLRTSPPTAPG